MTTDLSKYVCLTCRVQIKYIPLNITLDNCSTGYKRPDWSSCRRFWRRERNITQRSPANGWIRSGPRNRRKKRGRWPGLETNILKVFNCIMWQIVRSGFNCIARLLISEPFQKDHHAIKSSPLALKQYKDRKLMYRYILSSDVFLTLLCLC